MAPGVIPSGITLLELSSDIGTLTSEQLALVQTNNCVIKYTGNTSGLKGLYHKSYDSTEGIDYNKIQETKSNDNVRSYYFTCIKETGEYNFGTNTDARPRVVGNPTIQEGTTPPTLMNLRIGFTDYAIPQGGGSDPNAVHFTQQSLTSEQQAQARTNIDAGTYSKPSAGIPASDLASGVIPDVSGKENTSNKVTSLSAQSTDTQYPSAKATYDAINPSVQSSQPAGGMLPNVLYKLGTLTGSVTIAFATPSDANIENEYKFTFTTDSTAPTISWPASVTKWCGNAITSDTKLPNVKASSYYEVSVIDGLGVFNKFE